MSDDPLSDDNDSTRGVSLTELNDRLIRAALAENVRSWIPARVESYDAATRKANVQILVYDFHRDEGGALVVAAVPVINCVPVVFPTAGGFTLSMPVVKGTLGSIFFGERSLDRWLSGNGDPVDPAIYSRFNLTDAQFVAGLLPFGAPLEVADPTDHATLGSISGVRIHFRDDGICIGDESGAKFLVLNGDALTASSQMAAWALVVEQLFTAICTATGVPNPFTPANKFAGATAGNPGKAGQFGTVVTSATQAKGH